ncbi:MAG: preprotein translocase subunit YajC [Actinomycetia bacterium]|nr:preprotein translocase subunit YajC [Actinomycetes bacterium]
MSQEDLYALLPFVLLALVFWFLVFRPARKRQRETMQTQASLEAGRRVMLTSGIFGDVVAVEDDTVQVEIAPGTVISAHRQSIGRVVSTDEPNEDAETGMADASDDTPDDDTPDDDTTPAEVSAGKANDEPELPTHEEK